MNDAGQDREPAEMARNGYKAQRAGRRRVIFGSMNNVPVDVSTVLVWYCPPPLVAAQVHKQSAPVDGKESIRQHSKLASYTPK